MTIRIDRTAEFNRWLTGLTDIRAAARIEIRIDRLKLGNPGDVRPIGDGLSELRIDYGPGYRVYIGQRGKRLIIVLAGGDKRTQTQDIALAKRLWSHLED